MLSKVSKRELTDVVRLRYARANKSQQTKTLDEFVAMTAYNRKYAIHLLNHPGHSQPQKPRPRSRTYTAELLPPLIFIWEVCGHICSRRLRPFLPEMAAVLERLGHLHLCEKERQLLAQISRSTIDRLLALTRKRLCPHGRSTTKPGTLLSETEAARRPRRPHPYFR
jgi:hypothetical protein